MDNQQETLRTKYDVNKHLIDKVWEDPSKGLRKELLNFRFCSIDKPSELSRCLIEIHDVQNLNVEKHESNYLSESNMGKEFWVGIGHALTPIDCYIEEFLKQMFTNETSKCSITTKSSEKIEFTVQLKKIQFVGYYYEQSASQMFKLAKMYKENGVKMFKKYPKFAQNYFNLAAKCLLAFNPFTNIEDYGNRHLRVNDFEELLEIVYLNIAACLLKQGRYEDVLHVLKYTINQKEPSEKAVYRLSLAYFHLKQFENAKNTIEKIDYQNNKDLVQLLANIGKYWKADNDKYSSMVKKMFA